MLSIFWNRTASILFATLAIAAANVAAAPHCPLPQDAAAPMESQIDVLVAAIDDCDQAGTLGDEAALKAKALLIKLRADIAEVRRRHRGDLLDGDRTRFSTRLTRILGQLPNG